MVDEGNRRFTELLESFRQLEVETPELQVSPGRFLLIPPGEVRLTAFRARLGGTSGVGVSMVCDATSARLNRVSDTDDGPSAQSVPIDLGFDFVLDGTRHSQAPQLAAALLERMQLLLSDR